MKSLKQNQIKELVSQDHFIRVITRNKTKEMTVWMYIYI